MQGEVRPIRKFSAMHRRPLAIRSKQWPIKFARFLTKLGLTANSISVLSVFFGLATFGFLTWSPQLDQRWNLFWAAVCIQGRLICNLLDGLVAVEGGRKTPTGGLYNEVPDRFCDAFTLIGIGYFARQISFSVELGYLATILAFLTAYIRVLGASLGTPSFFEGPQAKQQRMALCTVALFLTALTSYLPLLTFALALVVVGSAVTCMRRLGFVASALRSKAELERSEINS